MTPEQNLSHLQIHRLIKKLAHEHEDTAVSHFFHMTYVTIDADGNIWAFENKPMAGNVTWEVPGAVLRLGWAPIEKVNMLDWRKLIWKIHQE